MTVCKNAFSILYSKKNRRIFRSTSLITAGQTPVDNTRKHGHRGNAIPDNICAFIDEHIKEFPVKKRTTVIKIYTVYEC